MYGKTEGSASPNARAAFRARGATSKGPWQLLPNPICRGGPSAALPDAEKCSDPRAGKGQGSKSSTTGSEFLLG